MRRVRILDLMAGLTALAALVVVGCAEGDPQERVAKMRGRYTATLNAFIVKETPIGEPQVAPQAEGEAEAAAEEVAEGDLPEEMAMPEMRQDVEVDLLVQHDNDEPLPGVTVDITMADAAGVELARWKVWVETERLPKANQKQVSHILEDVDYQEGYGFNAEVRHPVPAAERGEYREFSLPPS